MSKWATGNGAFYSPDGTTPVFARRRGPRADLHVIERDNPEAARRVAKIIYDGCDQLKEFPHIGRPSPRMSGRRELVFPPLPYITVYQVKENAVRQRAGPQFASSTTLRQTNGSAILR
jgi:plasmid stabilization system protein ParE